MIAKARHIKSRERVRDLGEVYTQPREIQAMLDLIPDAFVALDTRFLEPASGDGNFLVAILERKIALVNEEDHGGTEHWFEFAVLRCLASTYGVDINEENVAEARARMLETVSAEVTRRGREVTPKFKGAAEVIVGSNVVVGDSINGDGDIIFIEYTPLPGERFQRVRTELSPPEYPDLFYVPPDPLPTVHYSELVS